jgi:hypothetical protein
VKVIFLDFDGVLNSRRFFAQRSGRSGERADDALDPDAVARVNRIIERTGAKIVISSSWRMADPLARIMTILRLHGFTGEIVGTTPVLSGTRGREIKEWLRANRGVTAYVILDDATDMDGLGARHVLTHPDEGLLDAHVDMACAALARRRFWPW